MPRDLLFPQGEAQNDSAKISAKLASSRNALTTLDQAFGRILTPDPLSTLGEAGEKRGYFTPSEDDRLRQWFARFLTLRHHLFEIVDDMQGALPELPRKPDSPTWGTFLTGYTAACLIALGDRFLVETCAQKSLLQRKLNEPEPMYRIPAKQYTVARRSWTHPRNAWKMLSAMRHAQQHRPVLEALKDHEIWSNLANRLPDLEQALLENFNTFAKAFYRYQRHNLRRRGAVFQQRAFFSVLAASGRWLSKKSVKTRPKRVSAKVQQALFELLRPGDVVITRHDYAMTNLFLPGYWPHAALFVGSPPAQVDEGNPIEESLLDRWRPDTPFLEALKDGVRFRQHTATLAVDSIVIIRPQLSEPAIQHGISRAISHEGKPYNFDFDFFRSDRLVCTEVVYRAYDGLENLHCSLQQRSGRPTFSAEDLLDMAVDQRGFTPIALFGTPSCRNEIKTGEGLREAIAATYRKT